MSRAVLDASALIALLREEPGAKVVEDAIADSLLGSVNYAEVVSHFVHAGMPATSVADMLRPLPLAVVDCDKELAARAGELRAVTASAGLSLGDRFCLALALRESLPAWTADQRWQDIAATIGAEILLIR